MVVLLRWIMTRVILTLAFFLAFTPMGFVLLFFILLSALIVLTSGSAVAPFIYTLVLSIIEHGKSISRVFLVMDDFYSHNIKKARQNQVVAPVSDSQTAGWADLINETT